MLTGKGSRQKKKKCVKATAYPCKFACIRREKKCRNPLKHSQAKDYVLWLARQEERLAAVNAHRTKKGRSQFALTESKLGIVEVKPVPTKKTKKSKSKTFAHGYSKEEQATLKTAHQRNLYGIAAGLDDTRSVDKIKEQDELLTAISEDNLLLRQKIDRLKQKGLSEQESIGVALWTQAYYQPMNEAIYAPSSRNDIGEAIGVRAAQGLKKLAGYSESTMKELIHERHDEEEKVEDNLLRRHISVASTDMPAFLEPYTKSIGKEIKEPTFLATSAINHFFSWRNVTYVVTPKSDGSGQGKPIDFFRDPGYEGFEGEVLFSPYSRFKVLDVEKSSDEKIAIHLEEL